MDADALLLSRIQFAFVVSFHILLPAFTIGLASFIAVLEALHVRTRNAVYLELSQFWVRIFAVSFGMGVVSGVVMPFQFGTNWASFSDRVANVTGPLMAYEVLTAFFLEATFLGVLLFGRKLVPPWAHLLAAIMVAFGTLTSAFWILAVNSWMQTPQGHEIVDGRFFPLDWWAIIFNPSFPYRFAHTVLASFITTGFVVAGVSAWHLLRGSHLVHARTALSMTLWLLTVLVPLQILMGDLHGLNTKEHQPAKLAAMEGAWETRAPAPLTLFALPDQERATNDWAIEIPYAGSLILDHSVTGEIRGLGAFPRDQWPYVPLVFWAFRLMVGLGFLMLAIVGWGLVLRRGNRIDESRAFLRALTVMIPSGFVAILAGWTTTEAGRQPWTVYGLMRTAESGSPSLTAADVWTSLSAYVVMYLIVFGAGVFYLARLAKAMPTAPEPAPDENATGPLRPASAGLDAVAGPPR